MPKSVEPESLSNGSPLIRLIDVTKHYGDGNVTALDHVSLDFARNQNVSLLGPSGCGKSTLLNLLGALDQPTSGEVWVGDVCISSTSDLNAYRRHQVGFVFQSFHLLSNLTAEENVQIPMFGKIASAGERGDRARELLHLVSLGDRLHHLPHQLSNGQRQRVAIARALANHPQIILADEPTGALDSETGDAVMRLLQEISASQNTTLVMVTHDERLARQTDRIIRMKDGRIIDDQ